MKFEGFLFDLDGTLIDSLKDISIAANKVLKDLGYQEKQEEEIKKYIGSGAVELFRELLQNDKLIENAVLLFKGYYAENPISHTRLYEGVLDILELLKSKNKKIAVISNKPLALSVMILQTLNVDRYFDDIVGPETYGERKPSAIPVSKTIEKLNLDINNTILIGDTYADIESSKNAGCCSALSSWGYVKLKDLKPDFVLNSIYDIKSFI